MRAEALVVALVIAAITPAALAEGRAWTEPALELRVVEELAREGVFLSERGAAVELSSTRAGGWAILLTVAQGDARVRIVERLPDDAAAAAAEVATIVSGLLGAPRKPPSEPPLTTRAPLALPPPPGDPILDTKLRAVELLGRGPIGSMTLAAPPELYRALHATTGLSALVGVLLPEVATVDTPTAHASAATAGALMAASLATAFAVDERSEWSQTLPTGLGLLGMAAGTLGAGYSAKPLVAPDGTLVLPAGPRPPMLVTGSALAAAGGLLLLTTLAGGCSPMQQARGLDAVLLSQASQRAARIAALDACTERDATGFRRWWWAPMTALLSGAAGLALSVWADRGSDVAVSQAIVGAAELSLGALLAGVAYLPGPASVYADRLATVGITVGVGIAPTPGGGMVGVHGTF